MASEQVYFSRGVNITPFQVTSSPAWQSNHQSTTGSREISPLSRDSSSSPASSNGQMSEDRNGGAAQHREENRTEYSACGSEPGSSPTVGYTTETEFGPAAGQYNQFDIKSTYPEESLGIIPMPVEVGSPCSQHSDEDEYSESKRMKLPDAEEQDELERSERRLSSAGQFDLSGDLLEGGTDGMVRKCGKPGEGKSAPRTVILPAQREALELLWQVGMKSTSRKLRTLQEQAQQETGLRMDIIHNWIHNRRRKKNQEDLVSRASKDCPMDSMMGTGDHSDDSDISHQTGESIFIPSVTPTSQLMVINQQHMENSMATMTSGPTLITTFAGPMPVTVLNPAAIPNMSIDTIQRPGISVIQKQAPIKLFPEFPCLTSPQNIRPVELIRREFHRVPSFRSMACQTSPLDTREGTLEPFVAKVCCNRKELTHGDFIEVDVPMHTYSTLLNTLCQELGLHRKAVARIRKLPDVWVRSDSDVHRMTDFVELEVILRDDIPLSFTRS